MAMSTGGKAAVKAEPNVTPMIDVMLVLLIIFMIIVPSITSGFNAVPPSGQNLKPHPEEDNEQILGIDNTGQYFVNRKPVRHEDLERVLTDIYSKRTGEDADKRMYLKADKGLQYAKVVEALDIAAKSGVRMTAMITEQAGNTKSKIASDQDPNPPATSTSGGM